MFLCEGLYSLFFISQISSRENLGKGTPDLSTEKMFESNLAVLL